MAILGLLGIGFAAGIMSGLLGIGGAIIIVPALVYIFKTSQHLAQGTAIGALLLPVGILAAMKYWQAGNLNIKFALIIALAFLIGGYFGAQAAQPLPEPVLRKLFGGVMLIIALQMIFWS